MINKKNVRRVIIFITCSVLFVILIDLAINPLPDKPFYNFIKTNKNYIFLFVQLALLLAIFWFQDIYQEKQFQNQKELIKKQQEIIDKVDKNVKELSPLKELEEIETVIKKWLNEEKENVILFYFPYSIHPGFWYDSGLFFSNFINELRARIGKNYKSKLYFIGPDLDRSPFSKTLDALEKVMSEQFVNEYIKKNEKFYTTHNFHNFTDTKNKEFINAIREEYKDKLEALEKHKRAKTDHFEILKIGEGTTCNINDITSLPSFSFILKINKNKAEDMVVIDTFNFIGEADITTFIDNLGIDSIWNNSKPEILLMQPQFRLLNNKSTSNLTLTSFMETFLSSSEFDSMRNTLKLLK